MCFPYQACCCALIHDPDLLILDEPTTGVDPLSRRQFWDLVDRIRAGRPAMSVIVATAYMEEAERFGHLVAMNGGAVLATGTPAEIRQRTGCDTLDESFIALLPEAVRAIRVRPDIPPLKTENAEIAISAVGLSRRFGVKLALDVPAGFGQSVRRGAPDGNWRMGGRRDAVPRRNDSRLPGRRATALSGQSCHVPGACGFRDAACGHRPAVPATIRISTAPTRSCPRPSRCCWPLFRPFLVVLAVVREKEFGSITNLYVTPVTRAEFILGKQILYVVLAMAGFGIVATMASLLFGVPVKGSVSALVAGTLIYVYATTAYGLLISAFASTQIAAFFGAAMLTVYRPRSSPA